MIIKKRTTAGMTSQEWLNAVRSKREYHMKIKLALAIHTLIDIFNEIIRHIEFLFWRIRWWPFLKRKS